MKANEAPEKIYIPTILVANTVRYKEEGSIEYVRTDAFIEKVCNLLSRMVWEVTYEDLEGDSVEHYDKTEFIDEFRKYLESKV
jgi:hypothetical protein